jgi:hypothetical protein
LTACNSLSKSRRNLSVQNFLELEARVLLEVQVLELELVVEDSLEFESKRLTAFQLMRKKLEHYIFSFQSIQRYGN